MKPFETFCSDLIINEASSKGKNTFKVGDVLYTEWGYSMTLVNFYKITKLINATKFMVISLGDKVVKGELGLYGTKVPDMSDVGQIEREAIVKNNNHIEIAIRSNIIKYAILWNGKPVTFNHIGSK